MTRTSTSSWTLLACGILASQPAWAGYDFELGGAQGSASLAAGAANISTRGVNFGAGRVDLRSGENTGTKADWQEFYLKPGVTLNYSINPELELLGGVSAVAATTIGDGDAGGYSRSSDGSAAMEEAFVGIRMGDWQLTGGRQNYMIGTGFIVGDGNLDMFDDGAYWLAPRTAFRDSALLSYSQDSLQTQAFSLRTDDHLGDFRMSGLNLDYRLADAVTLGLTGMQVDSLVSQAQQLTPRDGMRVYNLRALDAKVPGLDDLSLHAEYALQKGSGDGVDYDAKAWYAQADYSFSNLPLTPLLSYRYAVFSGDDDLTDSRQKSWDPLSKGFIDWGTWLMGDVVGNYLLFNSNQRVSQWTAKTHLSETLTLGGIHYQFSLDEKNYFGTPVTDRRFADESVIFLDWAATPSLLTSISYNWVKPKGAAKEVFGNDTFSALEMYLTYLY